MSVLAGTQGEEGFVLAIAGAPDKRYHSPSDVAWDRTLDPDRQLRVLEKWLALETARYIEERETASLLRLREIKGMLRLVKRIRG